ncbi:transcription factor SPT20 homolog [Xenia sp. Carnegie-2017]|uniref:transcription factor SPT20 homolog n=1 Tax=Xenia sp. Carnegie-2017 TaxID=2897299 RepID=UPI001F040BEB|nr:transcription factor SPT20 homolog [Xenia sp. Carnegie-2017]XP_046855277.1 transcription factor SPT20 homolog [Xenia sp. Carnegie-2017]XP_046855278.1 transcription factor SPT20 homolog [Xenia sp. Carnegie-2017]
METSGKEYHRQRFENGYNLKTPQDKILTDGEFRLHVCNWALDHYFGGTNTSDFLNGKSHLSKIKYLEEWNKAVKTETQANRDRIRSSKYQLKQLREENNLEQQRNNNNFYKLQGEIEEREKRHREEVTQAARRGRNEASPEIERQNQQENQQSRQQQQTFTTTNDDDEEQRLQQQEIIYIPDDNEEQHSEENQTEEQQQFRNDDFITHCRNNAHYISIFLNDLEYYKKCRLKKEFIDDCFNHESKVQALIDKLKATNRQRNNRFQPY